MTTSASNIPALPVPQTNAPWPSFALSHNDRRAIAEGRLPTVRLGVTGTIVPNTPAIKLAPGKASPNPGIPLTPTSTSTPTPNPPTPSPVVPTQNTPTIPVRSSSNSKPPLSVPAPAAISHSNTTVNPTNTTPAGSIVRSTSQLGQQRLSSLTTTSFPTSPQPVKPGGVVRTSNPNPAGSAASSSPASSYTGPFHAPGLPVFTSGRLLDTGAGRFALAAFIVPFISILAFCIGLGTGLLPADLIVLFGSALLADISGITALSIGGLSKLGKGLAGWGISLGTLSIVAEIVRIIIWP